MRHLVTQEPSVRLLMLAFKRSVCYIVAKIWPRLSEGFRLFRESITR